MREVVLVEDDESVRESLGTILKLDGFRVAEFDSAEAFLAHARIEPGTVLVFDIDLPGISGLQALARLRAAGNRVPAIVVSGRATDEMRREAKRLDARAFLTKPIDLDRLMASLTQQA
ncbi:response regulator transcription factor [Amorphus orientalis]|uniref:FixJ family two-component response regulator n=1 Tax=Amorphus orientalis TaxID=649198 RepID=A0AAE3VRL0_9HYPH|nr:response regulator [Amorphus orientalis]MDQ0316698.1 FixJ family two-component response regulator [Amorphus orientalis]